MSESTRNGGDDLAAPSDGERSADLELLAAAALAHAELGAEGGKEAARVRRAVERLRTGPAFTQQELWLCLDQAALIRDTYREAGLPPEQQPEEYREAKQWDVLAAKVARRIGVEVEQRCHRCRKDRPGTSYEGGECRACEGTGVLPPRPGAASERRGNAGTDPGTGHGPSDVS